MLWFFRDARQTDRLLRTRSDERTRRVAAVSITITPALERRSCLYISQPPCFALEVKGGPAPRGGTAHVKQRVVGLLPLKPFDQLQKAVLIAPVQGVLGCPM